MPFIKGKEKTGGIKKGQKQYKTIAKEQARKIFEEMQLEGWLKISKKQFKDSLKNRQAREYTINQVIGKPKEHLEIEGEAIKVDVNISDAIKRAYNNRK